MSALVVHGFDGRVVATFEHPRYWNGGDVHIGTCPDCGDGIEIVERHGRWVPSPRHRCYPARRSVA